MLIWSPDSSFRVCSLWSKVAIKLKKQRRTRSWTCLRCEDSVDDDAIVENTKQFLQTLYTEPRVVFMFCHQDFFESFADLSEATRSGSNGTSSSDFGDFVRRLLPSSCTLVGMGSAGVVGTSQDLKEIHEIEEGRGVSFLCLPGYEGVKIICDETSVRHVEIYTSDLDIADILNLEEHAQCQAILSFISDPYLTRQIGFDLMNKFTTSLIAGGYVDTIIPIEGEDIEVLKCVALCGPNLKVASCVIRENVNTPRKAEDCIKKLKAQNLSEANSFAFMFACVGRGAGFYGEPNIESVIFKKHFPKTPLFGFFGNGEIGFEFVSGQEESTVNTAGKRKKKSPPRLYHAYTTILVLVSITGNPC